MIASHIRTALAIAALLPALGAAGTLYIANGTGVGAYDTTTKALNYSLTPSSTSWNNAFAVTVDNSGNVYVADAGNNRVVAFNSTGSQFGVLSTITDASGISPQELALDASGNLYTTTFAGSIESYASATGSGTQIESVPGARGITVANGNVFVSASAYGGGTVQEFATTGGLISTIYTSGAYPDGQMRGLAVDAGGDLFFSDSTWTAGAGYIEEDSGGTFSTLISGLAGPNELAIGPDGYLYVADYFGGDVKYYDTSTGALVGTFVTGLGNISGIAFDPGVQGATGATGPTGDGTQAAAAGAEPGFFQSQQSATPEPAAFLLAASGLMLVIVNRRRNRA